MILEPLRIALYWYVAVTTVHVHVYHRNSEQYAWPWLLLRAYYRFFMFVIVSSRVGRYFHNMYITNKKLKLCFPLMSRKMIYFDVCIILDSPVLYGIASVRCQSGRVYLHKTVIMVGFFLLKVIKIYRVCS